MVGVRPASEAAREESDGASFEDAHRELLGDGSIQFELKPLFDETQQQRSEVRAPSSFEPGPIPQFLFWVLIGLAAAGLLYLILVRVAGWRRRDRSTEPAPEPEWSIAEESARTLLGEADALAAQGLYSQAAHLLLHRSIEEIDQRRPATVRKALTSRDIAGIPAIPPSPAEAFSRIVRAVERSLFGGQALDAGDWSQCRQAYEHFAFAREWQV
jgi:hypothetical protein